MDTTEIKGYLIELNTRLKQRFASLTDGDHLLEEGKEDELYGRLEKRLGKSKEEVKKMFFDL